MKTILKIEIETPTPEKVNYIDIETGKDKTPEETKEYLSDLHSFLVKKAEEYFEDDNYEEDIIDSLEELTLEDGESFEDYGIKISVTNPSKQIKR